MPFLCASFCQGLCFRRSEARVAVNQHVHTRVRVDIAYNVVRDIEYGQNSMSEIKTLAHKMDIGRYGKLGTLGPKIFVACGGQKVVFTIGGVFAIHIRSATLWSWLMLSLIFGYAVLKALRGAPVVRGRPGCLRGALLGSCGVGRASSLGILLLGWW